MYTDAAHVFFLYSKCWFKLLHDNKYLLYLKNELQSISISYRAEVLLVNPLVPSGPCGCRMTTTGTPVNSFRGLCM